MPATAWSISASSNTISGALPPSSSDSFLTVSLHWRISSRPVAVEPVKLSLRTTGLWVSAWPMSCGWPVSTWKTPAGMPASWASTPRARAVKGVLSAGLTSMVQPAASAGPALRVIMAAGKFQGVMAAHTPMGSRSVSSCWPAVGDCSSSPSTRLPSSANHSMKEAA